MNIIVSIDDNYVLPLRVMLTSLFIHNHVKTTVYLFYSDLAEDNIKKIREITDKYEGNLCLCRIQNHIFEDAFTVSYFTKTMYYRLLSSQLLSESEERALYLDPDIVINSSIADFYNSDFEGKQMIAMPDRGRGDGYGLSLGIRSPYHYINSGVLLLNLKLMREKVDFQKIKGLIADFGTGLCYPDQDIINMYFKEDIKYGDGTYNTVPFVCPPVSSYLLQFKSSANLCILHYAGPDKPWRWNYYGKYFLVYDRYFLKTVNEWQYHFWRVRYIYIFIRLIWESMKKIFRRILKAGNKSVE